MAGRGLATGDMIFPLPAAVGFPFNHPMSAYQAPVFLTDLLRAKSPSGAEAQAQAVYDHYVRPHAAAYTGDPLGNRIATLNPAKGTPSSCSPATWTNSACIITYVNKDGFIYFDTIGGHDRTIISGRRVIIQTAAGPVIGVTGKRAIHLMEEADRKKVPEIHEIWIDIGARSKKEALERIAIGDVATYDHELAFIQRQCRHGPRLRQQSWRLRRGRNSHPSRARQRPQKTRRQNGERRHLAGRNRRPRRHHRRTYAANPHIALAVDVGHATDHPDCDNRKYGETKLGGGPILCRGANINPKVFERLVAAPREAKIPYQIEADPRPTGTDARAIQMGRGGVATGLVSASRFATCTPPARS
jgi:putative aminopeptidase FrvX